MIKPVGPHSDSKRVVQSIKKDQSPIITEDCSIRVWQTTSYDGGSLWLWTGAGGEAYNTQTLPIILNLEAQKVMRDALSASIEKCEAEEGRL
jgi:hypothetical protein